MLSFFPEENRATYNLSTSAPQRNTVRLTIGKKIIAGLIMKILQETSNNSGGDSLREFLSQTN
jgi:hypothetical protein